MSCAVPSSAERPSCSVRETLRLSWCWRSSSRFLNCSNFRLSMYVPTACSLAAFLKLVSCLGQTFIIFAEIEKRQLSKVAVAGASRTTVYALCFRLYAFGLERSHIEPFHPSWRRQSQFRSHETKANSPKKKRPHFWGHPKEAREGGKVREGDAYRPANQSRIGDVEIVRRGLKSFG